MSIRSLKFKLNKLRSASKSQSFFSFICVIILISLDTISKGFLNPINTKYEAIPTPTGRSKHMPPDERVTLIIPFRDTSELLETCIKSIFEKTTYTNYELLLINNQSAEQKTYSYLDNLQTDPRVTIIEYDQKFNYAAMHNWAMQFVQTEYVLLLNNDTEVIEPTWLTCMMSWAKEDRVGVVGALLLYPNRTVQHGGVSIYPGAAYHLYQGELLSECRKTLTSAVQLLAVTGACLLTKKSLYGKVDGMDDINLQIDFNDIDYCLKIHEAGYKVILEPKALLYHHESYTRAPAWSNISKYLHHKKEVASFWNKWGEKVKSMQLD